MSMTDVVPGPPIPGGSRWLKTTNPHPGQVVKIKRSNGLSVFYIQERAGSSQGRNSRVHSASYDQFLRDFEPYTKRDWNLAQKIMATLEKPPTAVEAEEPATDSPEPQPASNGHAPGELVASAVQAPDQADIDVWDAPVEEDSEMPVPDEDAPPIPIEEAKEIEAEAARRWRTKVNEFSETEVDEIVELWRSRINGDERSGDIGDIAATYGAPPSTIYAVISARVPQEYLLQRVVDQLKRNTGPIPAYKISQWMHLKKDEVEALCTSEAAQQVLRYSVETNDPNKPWIKTPMVELLAASAKTVTETVAEAGFEPAPAEVILTPVPEPEPETIPTTEPEPVQEEIPVATVSPAVEEAAPPMAQPTPISRPATPSRKYRWRVSVRTTIDDVIEANDAAEAIEAVKAKYADKPAMVVSVLMED